MEVATHGTGVQFVAAGVPASVLVILWLVVVFD